MATFVVLAKFTDQGIKNAKDVPRQDLLDRLS